MTDSLFEAATSMDYMRMPELFCGLAGAPGLSGDLSHGFSPQAWSAAAIFLIVQTILGIAADVPKRVLYVNRPTLPSWLTRVEIRDMMVGWNASASSSGGRRRARTSRSSGKGRASAW